MAIQKQPVDVVVVGMGWAGSIAAKELSDAGLSVVGLERGDLRTQSKDFDTPRMYDELPFNIRNALAMDLSRETITFRNNISQTALPMRQIGSFNPGTGTGGSGVTWSGHTFRKLPSDLRLRSHIVERYGKNFIPPDMTILLSTKRPTMSVVLQWALTRRLAQSTATYRVGTCRTSSSWDQLSSRKIQVITRPALWER